MLGLTRNLALEFAEDRIRVNAICPGMINTASFRETLADRNEAWAAREVQPLPYWGEEKDAALAAVYLASDESKFVTGATLVLDGAFNDPVP